MTPFYYVYDKFLGKITDDMYLEITPQDTLKDLYHLLVDAIPNFEFPRKRLDYVATGLDSKSVFQQSFLDPEKRIEDLFLETFTPENTSYFNEVLTDEEINILALLMVEGWISRQVASIEVTRMKYSGSDFKMTSQANHLSKLLTLKTEARRAQFHMQRLYKRRKRNDEGYIESNWSILRETSAIEN